MHFTISTSANEATVARRLCAIFGVAHLVSEPGANFGEFRSLGTGNNLAYRKDAPGEYTVWYRFADAENVAALQTTIELLLS